MSDVHIAEPTRTFRPSLGSTWWLRKRTYFLYMVRDLSPVFVCVWLLWLLWEISRLKTGAFKYQSSSAGFVVFSAICFFFASWHSITFLNLSGLILRIPIGDRYAPASWVKMIAFAGWGFVTALLGFFLIWLGSFKP
jgi:fumarate reductase subunit C